MTDTRFKTKIILKDVNPELKSKTFKKIRNILIFAKRSDQKSGRFMFIKYFKLYKHNVIN